MFCKNMNDTLISVEGLTKTYHLFDKPSERVKEAFHPFGKKYHKPFDALKNISFRVGKGESFGIIGRNGSGKSTLLQLICGILTPTSGSVSVKGKVAALLELGAGFNPEFTGRENVYMNGAILGFSATEMDERFDDIAAFADIGEFLDHPVKTYSSGMYIRLAFAVQTFVEPDILVIDEALSVGDIFFQQKCFRRMRELREQKTTLLFVSHDMGIVRDLCEKAIFLHKGSLSYYGPSHKAVQLYYENETIEADGSVNKDGLETGKNEEPGRKLIFRRNRNRNGNDLSAEIIAVDMADKEGNPSMRARIGDEIVFKVTFRVNRETPLHISVSIKNRFNNLVSCNGSYLSNMEPFIYEKGSVGTAIFIIRCDMEAGNYTLNFNLSSPAELANRGLLVDETSWIGPLVIEWDYENKRAPFLGMFKLPVSLEIAEGENAPEEKKWKE